MSLNFTKTQQKKQIYCETLVWHWFNSLNTISFVGYSNNSLVIFESIMCVWVCDFTPTSVRLTWLCICINPYVKYAPYIFRCGSALVAFAAKRVDDEYTIYICITNRIRPFVLYYRWMEETASSSICWWWHSQVKGGADGNFHYSQSLELINVVRALWGSLFCGAICCRFNKKKTIK